MAQQWNRTTANDVFYRREPHLMRRYTALALDNISRDPRAFVAASLYRMARLFLVPTIHGGSRRMRTCPTISRLRSSAVFQL